ncbi:MAG: class I SAM-dependent methyltransferase [Burkholderiaceae bacterium]|jgi:cyclopropane fatty-acyl-phospholipid synthase-like methyltransferase
MLDYYNKRLQEYETVYTKPERQADLNALLARLQTDVSRREVLELACGTGWWTERLAAHAASWIATDADTGALDIVQRKAIQGLSTTTTLNAYQPSVSAPVDCVFAAHWYSHLRLDERSIFFRSVHDCLKPGGRLIMLDNNFVSGSSTEISRTDIEGNTYQTRKLKDGSLHEVLKNFPDHQQLAASAKPYFGNIAFDNELTLNTIYYWYASMEKV